MNIDEVKVNWSEQKDRLKAKFTVLTDSDMIFENDKINELYKRLQFKLGKTEEELKKIMREL